MGDPKLWLVLLIGLHALTEQGANSCPVEARFKRGKKYLYTYTAEGKNGVAGTANHRNGPKVSCKVELEVRSTCDFLMYTTECSLEEVSAIDPEGHSVYTKTGPHQDFQSAMDRHPLRFLVDSMSDIFIYHKQDPKNILNIKRGIISTLLAPSMNPQEDKLMSTTHGQCKGSVTSNAHEDIDTDVTVRRDLSECSHFSPTRLPSSPLALIRGLHTPLSMLLSSTQECNYQFDNRRKHMTSGTCTEKHLFRPFSHNEEYGISSVVTQTLTLQDSAEINQEGINDYAGQLTNLFLEDTEDKHPIQSRDLVLSTLRDLVNLGQDQGQQRAGLFHKLVTTMRGLQNSTLAAAVEEMISYSSGLTWQALAQCGTPACRSAMLAQFRKPGMVGPMTDAIIYGMSLTGQQTSPEEIWDLLSIAKHRKTQPVIYALGYAINNVHKSLKRLPHELFDAITQFFIDQGLDDCSRDEETSILLLRVIGMVGWRVQDMLEPRILACVKNEGASPLVQKTAVQALRKMELTPTIREILMTVYLDENAPVQTRVAAYLILIKSIRDNRSIMKTIVEHNMNRETNDEVRAFVASHLYNLRTSDELSRPGHKYFLEEFKSIYDKYGHERFGEMSHHRLLEFPPFGNLQSNVVAEPSSRLPKEVILKAASKMFGYSQDLLEVGLEGENLEPFAEALIGEDALIPNILSTLKNWMGENMSPQIQNLVAKLISSMQGDRMKRQVPADIMKEIGDIFRKFMEKVRSQESPEVLAYLWLMDQELGYIKASDLSKLGEYLNKRGKVIFTTLLPQLIKSFVETKNGEHFAHYLFMDENMLLPTASGFPLKLSLSGVFVTGAKGSFSISPNMLSFNPSAGVEFITHMGVHMPEFVAAGVEMHTNIYHENALNAKVTFSENQVKLSIPPPKGNIQLFSVSNKLLSVSAYQPKIMPSLVEDRTDVNECHPLIPGLKYCTILRYSNASSNDAAPYYPLTGETKFALELMPTGEVTDYSATIDYKLLGEGREGRHKVDMVKITFKMEGSKISDATATMKYNRNRNTFVTDLRMPDLDFEVGLKLTAGDANMKARKMRGFTLDVTNKNIPQLSLVGRARLESTKDAMVQMEMEVPSLMSKAVATANFKKDNGLVIQLHTNVELPKTTSQQAIIVRYDMNKVEVEMKSDLNSDFDKIFPNMEKMRSDLQSAIDDMLDQQVPKTDMKLRHIVSKLFDAVDIWLDKVSGDSPYVVNRRNKRGIPELPQVPKNIFLKWDTLFRYQFNDGKMTISLPLPFGGQASESLKIPQKLSIPTISVPEIGLEIAPRSMRVPSFTIPETVDVTLPLLGLAEMTTRVASNLCSWEATLLGGNNTVDEPSFIGQYRISSDCPLPYKAEGTGMITGTLGDHIKYVVNSSLSHSLLDASFSVSEIIGFGDDYMDRAKYRIEASSPLGLSISFQSSLDSVTNDGQLKADGSMDGDIKIGSLFAKFDSTQTLQVNDFTAKGESKLTLDSSLIQLENMINIDYTDDVFNLRSKTMTPNDALKHMLEIKLAECQFSLKSDATAKAASNTANNKIDLSISCNGVKVTVENQADDGTNRVYSVITGAVDSNGLELNVDGNLLFEPCRGSHNSGLNIGTTGLATSGRTSLLCSPLTFESTFNADIDHEGATGSMTCKASGRDNRGELKVEGKVTPLQASLNSVLKGNLFDADMLNTMNVGLNSEGLTFSDNMAGSLQGMKAESTHSLKATLWTMAYRSKADCFVCDGKSYKHDIKMNLKPFVATLSANNDIEFNDISLNSESVLKLEPVKIDLSGSITGSSSEGNVVKHDCSINYADLAGFVKCNTNAKLSDCQFDHNLDLQYAGLSSKLSSEAVINSKTLRLENTLRTMVEPFSLTVDSLLNSDSQVHFYGKHKGQLYSKFLLRAEPLGIAHSHDCRVSATHEIPSGETHDTRLENKIEGVLTPSEQSWLWKIKSKLNNHAYNQDITSYNNDDKIGIELTSVIFTNLLNQAEMSDDPEFQSDHSFENQEFSLSAFLKYDKNSDTHVLSLPFIDNLPIAFENFKASFLNILESLQQYMKNLDIDNRAAEFRATLERLPQNVENFIIDLDLEGKFRQANEELVSWMNTFAISVEDLETTVENIRDAIEKFLLKTSGEIRDIIWKIRESIQSGSLTDTITDFLTQFAANVKEIDETYDISKTLMRALEGIEEILRQIDMEKLRDSSLAWLQELDAKYEIRDWLLQRVTELKQGIDIMKIVQDLKEYISSFDLMEFLGQIEDRLPTEEIRNTFENMKDILVNWLDEYEVDRKINLVLSKIQELLRRYEVDKTFEMVTTELLELIKQYKIHETIQQVVNELQKIQLEDFINRLMEILNDFIDQFKSIDFKQSIEDLNEFISERVQAIHEFDFKKHIELINQKISEFINNVNDHIRDYEIPQKVEASREFLREIQSSIWKYLDQLKATRVGELLTMLKDVLDKTAYKDIQFKVQDILQDMRQRISDMDVKSEIMFYLERASKGYKNILDFISTQIEKIIDTIKQSISDNEMLDQISEMVGGILDAMKKAEIKIPATTFPLTDLTIPAATFALQNLQDIQIPSQITIPEFKVLEIINVPSFTIDFEELKQGLIDFIDKIRSFELPMVEIDAIFGDLRVLYMSDLPDLTFPQIKLSEIRFPEITIPKLDCDSFEITKLPVPKVKLLEIPSEVQVPAFGKLYGEIKMTSPHYTLVTTGSLENSTTTPKSPQFTATFNSESKSPIELLEFSIDSTMRLEAPRMKKLVLKETLKVSHIAFHVDHEGSLIFSGLSAEATAKTTGKVTTEVYTADLEKNFELALKNGISASMDTSYTHNLNIPSTAISSQATMTQNSKAQFESGSISLTTGTMGTGKVSLKDFSDEGTHNSRLEFLVNIGMAKLTFKGETNSKALRLTQDVNVESVVFSHLTIDAKAETQTPFIKSSVMSLKGSAEMEDLKINLRAEHEAELIGRVSGIIANSIDFMAKPFEMVLDCKNKGITRILFPFKLTGKIDLQHDCGFVLNSDNQRVGCLGMARFNQYKYRHNITLDNNLNDAGVYGEVNGEANLDFLTVPLSIPEMTIPYFEIKTPVVKELSLWENYGLSTLLTTPRQSFDMDFNLQYQKNPESHAVYFDLVPIYNLINSQAEFLQRNFEDGRDWLFNNLMDSYHQAKAQYEKHKINTSSRPPKYFRVPGYKVPILNIQVSAFTAEMPAFSYLIPKEVSTPSFKVPAMGFSVPSYTLVLPSLELPVLHVPETLRELTLPTFRLPEVQNSIMIPALGNMTYDFSLKSTVITLNANGGLFNQSDIVGRYGCLSTSVFDTLKSKFEGTTRLTMTRDLKLATSMTFEHNNIEANHDSSLSCSPRGTEATMRNVAKITSPVIVLEWEQESRVHSHSSPNFRTAMNGKFDFNIPYIDALGNGNFDQKVDLGLHSTGVYVESMSKAKLDGTCWQTGKFYGDLVHSASMFQRVESNRYSVDTAIEVKFEDNKVKILNVLMTEKFALESSLKRMYATMKLTGSNEANLATFNTNGKQAVLATLEMIPLSAILFDIDVDLSQPSNVGDLDLMQKLDLDITTEKQSLKWTSREQIISIGHACDFLMANNEAETRFEGTQSWEAYLAFLKSVKLPVYQKSLWDVLNFDQATTTEERQFFNASTSIVYTKGSDDYKFEFQQIPDVIENINSMLENANLPPIPLEFFTPHVDVPLTSYFISSRYIDLKNIKVPEEITVSQHELNLPFLPKVTIPELQVSTKYTKGRVPHLLVKLPTFEISVAGFSLSKPFEGITAQLPDCGWPPLESPRRYFEIPEMSLKIPASISIPTFGALSTTVKVASPIYTETWTTLVENKAAELVTSLKASCSSTVPVFEYDLNAKATWSFVNGVLSLNGISKLTHSDVNVNWQHTLTQNIRAKRQEPQETRPQHTLNIDITSPTFADANFRFASQKNGITASVSSPSAGFMGFLLQRRSPTQYYAKIFGRYLSSPDKDTDMVTIKTTLKNSEKLGLQVAWNWNSVSDILHGVKQHTPYALASLKRFANKHHTNHFGMDVNRASLKMKNSLSNTIERTYHEVPQMFNTMQNSLEDLSQQTREVYQRAADSIPSVDLQEMRDRFSSEAREFYRHYEKNARALLDAILQFLKENKFHLPGLEEKLSGQELYQRFRKSVSEAIEQFTKGCLEILDTVYSSISSTGITFPWYDQVVALQEDNKLPTLQDIEDHVHSAMKKWEKLRLETFFKSLNDFVKLCIQKVEEFITSLQAVNLDNLLTYVKKGLAEASDIPAFEEVRSQITDVRENMASYKDMAKMKVQEAYNGLTMENINQTVVFAVDVFESHFYGGANELHDQLRYHTQGSEPYIKISNKKAEVEIPLPFFWKSFSEWPTQTRE